MIIFLGSISAIGGAGIGFLVAALSQTGFIISALIRDIKVIWFDGCASFSCFHASC